MRKLGTSLQPGSTLEDKRACILCSGVGDGDTDGTARLLNVDVGVWIHLNCALWSDNVYETLNGALMNVMNCIKQGKSCKCCYCCKAGATVSCHKQRCYNVYHFGCAIQDHCMFFKDKVSVFVIGFCKFFSICGTSLFFGPIFIVRYFRIRLSGKFERERNFLVSNMSTRYPHSAQLVPSLFITHF